MVTPCNAPFIKSILRRCGFHHVQSILNSCVSLYWKNLPPENFPKKHLHTPGILLRMVSWNPPPKKKTLRSVSVIGHPHLKGGPTPISTGFVLWILYDFVGNPSFAEPTDETPSTPRLRSAG